MAIITHDDSEMDRIISVDWDEQGGRPDPWDDGDDGSLLERMDRIVSDIERQKSQANRAAAEHWGGE